PGQDRIQRARMQCGIPPPVKCVRRNHQPQDHPSIVLANKQIDGVDNQEEEDEEPGVKQHDYKSTHRSAAALESALCALLPGPRLNECGITRLVVRGALCARSETRSHRAPDMHRRSRDFPPGARTISMLPRSTSTSRRAKHIVCTR